MIDNKNRDRLHSNWNTKILFKYLSLGFKKIAKNRKWLIFTASYAIACLIIWFNRQNIWKIGFEPLKNLYNFSVSFLIITLAVLIYLLIVFFVGMPFGAKHMNSNLHRMGLTNSAGEAPILISKERSKKDPRTKILTFETFGIPLSKWQDEQEKIESALNLHIDYFDNGANCRQIVAYGVDGNISLPDKILWKPELLSPKSFELVLGESYTDSVTVDLSKVPHLLIGGSTGSGKSVLLKLLLMQCVCKGATVYIADFKGGVDFPPVWHQKCTIITEQDDLITILEEIVAELRRRKPLLQKVGCANIDEYNERYSQNLNRIIIACDEIAEILDKTGLDRNQKEPVNKIESLLSVIARQGRAFGIHLLIATQRPDANILNGQIRNNIDTRICGRADDVLSQIILDCTDASDKIPKNSQGRFLTNSGRLFQGYYFDDAEWE